MTEPTLPWVEKIAVIGDLHGKWTHEDVRFFNDSDFDLLLFVGDLGSGTKKDGLAVIRSLARLTKKTLVLPGNNDAEHLAALSAEFAFQAGKNSLLATSGGRLESPEPIGYSRHDFRTPLGELSLVAGRPLAQGGSELSFKATLERVHGISSLEESRDRYRSLVENAKRTLLFVAHNGPFGLGDRPESPWGRDFRVAPEDEERIPRDFGDTDLADAIEFAKSRGRRVLGIVAGHMHRGKKSTKPLSVHKDETLFVNAAWVPRVFSREDSTLHHHVALRFETDELRATEHFIER